MAQEKDHLSDLERHMQILEEKTAKLQSSLVHWQKWYLEYAALKEEVAGLAPDPEPRAELARIRRDFDSEVLTRKEVDEIFGKHDLKTRGQILSVLSRRVDYVEQNMQAVQKLLAAEEHKLAAAAVVAHPDAGTDESTGLPITDIIEQLDDEGNVLDYRLQSGGDVHPQVLDALKKAGIGGPSEGETDGTSAPAVPVASAEETGGRKKPQQREQPGGSAPSRPNRKEVLVPDAEQDQEASPQRKSVSFAEDTKPGHESAEAAAARVTFEREQIMQNAKELEAIDLSSATMPEDESEEDRELRRQMLQYGMSEIGPVVAELELEEGGSDDDDFSYNETDEDESEDEFGRSKTSVLTESYIERMKELEKRLGVQSAFTAEPHRPKTELPEEGIGRIAVRPPEPAPSEGGDGAGSSGKKSVKFAADVPEGKPEQPKVNPLGDVLERESSPTAQPQTSTEAPAKRTSRFKKERGLPTNSSPGLPQGPHQVPARFREALQQDVMPEIPTGPEGQIIANTLVEREVSSTPRNPDDFNGEILYQAASVEYNRLRNREIQRQGGFMKEDESPISPPEQDEPPPRVSRFKAARLSRT